MPRLRGKIVFAIRILLVLALVFALAGFRFRLPRNHLSVLFLVDTSLSVSPDNVEWARNYIQNQIREIPHGDKAGIILFGKDAHVEESLTSNLKTARFSTVTVSLNTDIGKALQMASALFPEDTVKRIILISDGNENLGDAMQEAVLLSARGIEVMSLPCPSVSFPEILVNRIEAPPTVSCGAPFALKMEIDSSNSGQAIINIFRNEELIAREKVEIAKGKNLFSINQQIDKVGNYKFRASVESPNDRYPNNNQAETPVMVFGPPRVLCLTHDPRQQELIAKALTSHQVLVEVGDLRSLPSDLSEIALYQAVIFDNINGLLLSPSQMMMIENYVRDLGGGFIMVGGDHSFGAGGYYDSPVERILPVNLDIRKRKNLPSIAMVLAIDKSGSMSEKTGNVEKIALAREAAIATIKLLEPKDKLGVICFDHAAKWVSILQYVGDNKKIIQDIASIRAGGGTAIYPALQSAYVALKSSQAMVKHVIVLTDGRSEPGDFKGILGQMTADKITVSAIGVGKDADTPFLEEMAVLGKGRFYYADEATLLPRIFVREAIMAGRSPIIEETFHPVVVNQAEFLRGFDHKKYPKLNGYVATAPKDRATLVLQTHQKDPLLAYWRIGLGKSVAFTSDDGLRWAKEWVSWDDYHRFWTQMTRWAMSPTSSDRFSTSTEVREGKGSMSVEALDEENNPINFLTLKGKIISPSGKTQDVTLTQTGSGRYETQFDANEVGTYFVNILEEVGGELQRGKLQAFSVPYSPEYRTFGNNRYLLEKLATITGGKVISPNFDVFWKSGNIAYSPRSAWRELLILILLLLPLDVALRRVYLPEGFYEKIKSFFIIRKPSVAQPSSKVGALKLKKAQLRQQTSRDETQFKKITDLMSKTVPEQQLPPVSTERKPQIGQKIAITPDEEIQEKPDGTSRERITLARLKKVKQKFTEKKNSGNYNI